MPSLLPGYQYDIFLSYRQNDNRSGWITEFVKALQEELATAIKDPVSIYFDENPHDGLLQHHEVDDSLKEKLQCLVLIPIVSQTYCDTKAFAWEHELVAFVKLASEDKLGLKTKVGGGNTASRVLPVRIHEVDARDKKLFEEVTGGIMRPIDFIYKESGVNRPLRHSDDRNRNQEQTDYRNQVNKVANAIKDIISGLQGTEVIASPRESSEVKRDSVPPIRERAGRRRMIRIPKVTTLFTFAVVSFMAFVALAILHFSEPAPDRQTYRSTILPPPKTNYSVFNGGNLALSPDGHLLAFVANDSVGNTLLWVRPLNALAGQALNGTEGASFPFWSPDSRFIGFFADGKLKKIEASGGPPQTICDAAPRGGTWNENGIIILSPTPGSPLFTVAAAGGLPVALTRLDTGRNQFSHRWPCFLPDGKHFLYSGLTNPGTIAEEDALFLASLDTSFTPRPVVNSGSSAGYANGHLLFVREQTLMALPFDPKMLQPTGEAFPVAEEVHFESFTSKASFSVSQTGNLVYQTGTGLTSIRLLWFDRTGKRIGEIGQPAVYNDLRLSPDGKRIAISQLDTRNQDLWLYETAREVWTRFTFDPSVDQLPVWSPDGTTIVFSQRTNLFQRAASGAGSEEVLLQSNFAKYPSDWSRDGKFLAYHATDQKKGLDIWILPMNPDPKGASGERKPFLFLQTDFHEQRAVFSPDGRWIAYQSPESGRYEVYIRPFPGPGGKWQVSTNGGTRPRWRNDGKELFYLGMDSKIMAAEIKLGSSVVDVGSVSALFQTFAFIGGLRDGYDVTGDGQRFLVASYKKNGDSSPVTWVVNWPAEIKK